MVPGACWKSILKLSVYLFHHTSSFAVSSTISVTLGRKSVARKKRMTRGKTRLLCREKKGKGYRWRKLALRIHWTTHIYCCLFAVDLAQITRSHKQLENWVTKVQCRTSWQETSNHEKYQGCVEVKWTKKTDIICVWSLDKEHKSEVWLFAKMGLNLLVRTLWVLTLVTALAVAQDDGVLEVPAPETTTVVIDPGKLTTMKYIFVIKHRILNQLNWLLRTFKRNIFSLLGQN